MMLIGMKEETLLLWVPLKMQTKFNNIKIKKMANVRVRWVDSLSIAATGNKIYREDVEIADIANGVQEYIDSAAPDGVTGLKYEVQAHDGAGDETTQEVEGKNMDYINTSVSEQLYRFNNTETSYFSTPLSLTGLSEISIVWDGVWNDAGDDVNCMGIPNSSTNFHWTKRTVDDECFIQIYDNITIITTTYPFVNDGLRHQHGFTYDAVNGLRAYIDGVQVGSSPDTSFTAFAASRLLQIGKRATHATTMDGDMYRAVVYNRGLSGTEMADLESNGIGSIASGKIADWGDTKVLNTWTDDISGNNASNEGGVTLV